MRVRLSDPTLIDEFLEFLWHSGFIAELESSDTALVSMPMSLGNDRDQEDIDLFLTVWIDIAVRVWSDLWPDTDAVVLPEPAPARRAAN